MSAALSIFGVILLAVAAAIVFVFLFIPLVKIFARLIGHVFATIGRWVTDIFRLIGTVLVIPVFMLLSVLSVVIGRWSAAGHYGRAVSGEIKSAGICLYRIALGHPLRLVGLHALIDGFEHRLPEVMAAAPGADRPRGRKGQFDGYNIVGSLAGGGSGGKLYIAQPDDLKQAAFVKRGLGDIEQVVIKTFSVSEGSTLPQIIRESRALDAAKRLGLIVEHDLTNERFYYVMRYIPGEPLSIVTQRTHADADPAGLSDAAIARLLGFGRDVLLTLNRYHTGGLWHKDIKPDNIIVDRDEAHVVDLGLITPLRSAMTLTTHGTEYFRDPELVRMALKGVKVNEVNGEKFDIYAAAAVMYSMIEGQFPAHGGLSQITKRCPEAIRWIIRRGMTDYDRRYESVAHMLSDLDVVLHADDPFSIKPASLPSMRGAGDTPIEDPQPEPMAAGPEFGPRPRPAAAPEPDAEPSKNRKGKARVRVANWWTGQYSIDEQIDSAIREVDDALEGLGLGDATVVGLGIGGTKRAKREAQLRRAGLPMPPTRRPAHEQIRDARARAAERRQRAVSRAGSRRRHARRKDKAAPGLNAGVAIAIGCAVGLVSIPVSVALLSDGGPSVSVSRSAIAHAPEHVTPPPGQHMAPHAEATVAHTTAGVPATPLQQGHGHALVMSTFSAPVSAETKSLLTDTIGKLRERGFNITDNVLTHDDENIGLFAELHTVRGIAADGLSAAASQVGRWFPAVADRFDVVVILEPDPEAAARGQHGGRVILVGDGSTYATDTISPESIAKEASRMVKH